MSRIREKTRVGHWKLENRWLGGNYTANPRKPLPNLVWGRTANSVRPLAPLKGSGTSLNRGVNTKKGEEVGRCFWIRTVRSLRPFPNPGRKLEVYSLDRIKQDHWDGRPLA